MSECMTQEDAMNMSAEQAIQILKPMQSMMRDQHGCPISDAYFALGKAIEALEESVAMVRCKDCRYFHENVFGDEIGLGKPYDCLIVGHCCCEFWGRKDDGSMTQTSPEGFCSFGERRSE